MRPRNGKISFRQAWILILCMLYSISIRFTTTYSSKYAKQVAWLTPVVAIIFFIALVWLMDKIFKNYNKESFMDVMYDVMGKTIGKVILALYGIYITIDLGMFVRYFGERIVTLLLPEIDIKVFIAIMVILVAIVLRSGLVVLARMSEIMFIILYTIFALTNLFLIPKLKIENLYPISYLDVVPILKGSMGVVSPWLLAIMIFFFRDKISDNTDMFKKSKKYMLTLFIFATVLLVSTTGSLGHNVASRTYLPFYSSAKQAEIFHSIEKMQAFLVTQWIFTDFLLIAGITYWLTGIIKSLFNLEETKNLISPIMVFTYFFSLMICNHRFELERLSEYIMTPANIILFFLIPLIVFIVGKIRKKI